MGLIVNKPLEDMRFDELLDELSIPRAPEGRDIRVLMGGPVDRGRLRVVLEQLPKGVLRVKGIVQDDCGARLLLQYAAGRWAITPTGAPVTGLVAIGTEAMAELDQAFAATLSC